MKKIQKILKDAERSLASGKLSEARAYYKKALTFDPGNIQALSSLGMIELQMGNIQQAWNYSQAVITTAPQHVDTLILRGRILRHLRKFNEAVQCYQSALAVNQNHPEANLELSEICRQHNQFNVAEQHVARVLAIEPNHLEAQNELASIRRETGDIDGAIVLYQKVLKCAPTNLRAFVQLARMTSLSSDSPSVNAFEKKLTAKQLDVNEMIPLHYALGHIYDKEKQYQTAFAHYQKANNAVYKRMPFDMAGFAILVENLKMTFTKAFFQSNKIAGDNSSMPIFIVGMPRSGSTLVEKILASHPAVVAGGEVHYLYDTAFNLPSLLKTSTPYPQCCSELSQNLAASIANPYVDAFKGQVPEAQRSTDKLLGNFLHLGLLVQLFPNAHIIHCQRDPLDTCLSCYFQSFAGGDLGYTNNLAALGEYYKLYTDLMAHWQRVLPLPIYNLTYEVLVNDTENEVRKLLDHCGLAWDDACLKFNQEKGVVKTLSDHQVRQGIYSSAIRRSENYCDFLGSLIEKLP